MSDSTREQLLNAIVADPDDIGIRQVYADYLLECGENRRGKLIALQCALARAKGVERAAIASQVQLLLGEYGSQFLREDLGVWTMAKGSYERGFLRGLQASLKDFFQVQGALLKLRPPLRKLDISTGEIIEGELSPSIFASLEEFRWSSGAWEKPQGWDRSLVAGVARVLVKQEWSRLRVLVVSGSRDALVGQLAEQVWRLPGLEVLRLSPGVAQTQPRELFPVSALRLGDWPLKKLYLNYLSLDTGFFDWLPTSVLDLDVSGCGLDVTLLPRLYGRKIEALNLDSIELSVGDARGVIDGLPELQQLQVFGYDSQRQTELSRHPRVKAGDVVLGWAGRS